MSGAASESNLQCVARKEVLQLPADPAVLSRRGRDQLCSEGEATCSLRPDALERQKT